MSASEAPRGSNRAYFATSLDGYIASADHGLEWLDALPAIEGEDYGFDQFMTDSDAILMGRATFEVISAFRPWPYDKPVFIASRSMSTENIPADIRASVSILTGSPTAMVDVLNDQGYWKLYVDGGRLITSFLALGLLEEMVITRLPVLLGEGVPVFGQIPDSTWWNHQHTESFSNGMVQSTYTARPRTDPIIP